MPHSPSTESLVSYLLSHASIYVHLCAARAHFFLRFRCIIADTHREIEREGGGGAEYKSIRLHIKPISLLYPIWGKKREISKKCKISVQKENAGETMLQVAERESERQNER